MIKSIIEKIMIKEFSKYINGIQYNKLTVEVLGGYFGIENISLNHEFFNNLETPLNITYSHIGKLSIEAPLTKLSSVPVSCTIQDVYVIAEHKKNCAKINEISKEQLLKKYIKETFEAIADKIKESKKEDGMLDKLGKKIIDNLKMQIKNIHIRFEEANQEHIYSFGLALKSLTFGTTDKNWNPIYIERQKEKQEEPTFKCMTIENFRLYWQSIPKEKAPQFLFLKFPSNKMRIQSMRKYVTNDSDSILNISSTIRLKINPNSLTSLPLFELIIELQPININFSKQKIVQTLDFTTSCIKYNEVMLKTLLDKALKKLTNEQQKKFKPLCSKFVQATLDKEKKKNFPSQQFKELLDNIAIEYLYQLAMPCIKEKVQQQREKELKKEKKSWFSSNQVQLTYQEKKEVEKLLNELVEDSIAKGRPQECSLLKIIFYLKGISFVFYDENKENKLKTIQLSIENIACVLQKSHNKSFFSIQNKIKKIVADLTVEENKALTKIHLMENICQGQNDYLIEFIYRQSVLMGKKTIVNCFSDLSLRKTIFTYKKQYWKMFNSFFSMPEINQQVQNEAMGKLQLLKKESSEDDSEEIEIQKHYNINLNLNSPTFILPLSASTYWYLDLGKISMKSQTLQNRFIYPFHLSELNMRYINHENKMDQSKSLIKSNQFFPILKNIDINVNMVTVVGSNIIQFEILLDKIELNATRQEFTNLMNVKKFIVGEEKDQIQVHNQQVKVKDELIKKKKIDGKVLKRNKYFYNWIEFYCVLSNNGLYLYPTEKELIPQSIIAVRGVKTQKNNQQSQPILEIVSNGETCYLQFKDRATLDAWENQIAKNLHELKDYHSLIMQGNAQQHKPKKKKKQDLININLKLNEMNWNYLNEKGESFLKIELKKINFKATEKEQTVETLFNIDNIQIIDKVFQYKNPKYQSLFIASKLSFSTTKTKEAITKINPTKIGVKLKTLYINWKPDAILLIIESMKQFLDIKPIVINKDITRKQIIQSIKSDADFNAKMEKYAKSTSNESIKEKRNSYLKMNEKDDQIYLKLVLEVAELTVNFIHRQSHMPMFLVKSQDLKTSYTMGKVQRFVDGVINVFQLYQITGYPQKKYDLNTDYEPYCLIRKQESHKNKSFVEFKYSSYEPQQIANNQRVDSFLHLNFTPVSICYFQEVFMRLIDYFFIQIVLLLNHSEVITVNEDILKQIVSNSALKNEKPKNFLQNQFQNVIKRFFYPFFMDYLFNFQQPEVILSPTKQSDNFFNFAFQKITITNNPVKCKKRFQNTRYQFIDKTYEQQIQIMGKNIIINSLHNGNITKLVKTPFNLNLVVNRLLFEDQINEITPQIVGYDRSFKIENVITAIQITELSKFIYENILRLPNFNLSFEDENNELFIHNFRITKMLAPKPISYKLRIEELSAIAKHSLDQIKEMQLKLWSISFHNFQLEMSRDQQLNILLQMSFSKAHASIYEYTDFNNVELFSEKSLVKIDNLAKKKSRSFVLVKLPNTGIIDMQCCIESCEINLNFGGLPLIADWVQPDDSVFAVSKKQDRLIKFLIRMPKVIVNLEQSNMYGQCLKMVGELIIDLTRKDGQSENYLRSAYLNKEVSPNFIEKLNNFMNIKVNLGLQFFTKFKESQRKILQKVKIQMREQYYYKIRNDQFRKTVRRRLNISELRGSISVDDIILLKSVLKSKTEGEIYQKQFKDKLKQTFIKSEKDIQKSIYKDLLNQQKILQEFIFNVSTIKFYLIHKQKTEYLPILRICTNKIQILQFVNQQNQVYNGELDIQAYYFNNQIFRWEPFVQNTKIKLNVTNAQNTNTLLEAEIANNIYINISSEMAVSIKKALNTVNQKLEKYYQGNYVPEQGIQYHSRYTIHNLTGYPIEIYDNTHKSQYFIMNEQKINYFTKRLQENFFEQNEIKEFFSFIVHHPSYQILEITNLSLESQRSFSIQLYDTRGRKLPEHCQLYLENSIDGCKKLLTIRSKKVISDYSNNILLKKYYPFDMDTNIVFTQGVHKGMKANFYSKTRNERFYYDGVGGNLVIRKTYLVYNYTVIPLNVCENIVIPGEFVGINQALTIQGFPYKESFLKVVYNDIKKEYYIYGISYIIDYTGLNFIFPQQYDIKLLYTYNFNENGKAMRIYLLPDINFQFSVKLGKNSTSCKLNGKLSRQAFEISADNTTYTYSCYSYLQSFCKNNIKEFKKIIQITNFYQLCNDTTETLIFRQINSIEKDKIILKPGQNCVFNWSNKFSKEYILITIQEAQGEWAYASPLPITKNVDTFIIRNKKQPSKHKIYSLELEETNNLTFIHILNSDNKYQICNDLANVKVTLYQTAIFENRDSQFLSKNADPSIFTYQLLPKEKRYFGFQLPTYNHQLTIHFESILNQQDVQLFTIDDLEKNVIQKHLELFKSKQKIAIKLEFNEKNKKLRFYMNRKEIFKKNKKDDQFQAKIKLKGIYLSLIGTHENLRKELINANFSTISFQFLVNKDYSQLGFQIQKIRIQNTIKPEPYFITLFHQEQEDNKSALALILKRSRFNPNLVYYIGFSMRKSTVTVTSEELQILEENINNIMEKVNAKSDTNFLINFDQKFKPAKIGSSYKLYFVEAQLHPLKFIMTYKHVNNWGGALLKALSINNCKMTVNGKKISNFDSRDLLDFASIMGKYFKQEFENQIFSMIGSLALLGSPLNLASKIGCGIQNLIELPADGFEDDGVLGIGKGLALGTGSLISNTVQGAFGSVQSITGAIGEGISGLASYDKKFEKTRQDIKNERVDHIGEGLLSGGKSIFNGIFTGITGLVTQPIKGAEKEGLGGFFKGGFKGLTGLIVKPVSGVIDATSKTAEGIKNTTKVFSKQTKEMKTRRYDPRPFYGYYREVRPYDPILARWNKQIALHSSKYSNLSWCNIYHMKNGEYVVLSYEYLLILNKKTSEIRASYQSSNIIAVNSAMEKIIIIAKNSQQQKQKIQLEPNEFIRLNTDLLKVFNYYTKNYELGLDRKSTPK